MRTAARIQARTMGRATAALFAFVGLVLAAETPALASPPTRVPERTVTYSLSADCGSFNVDYQGYFIERTTIFHDSAGNDLIGTDHFVLFETDTNSVTGETLRAKGSWTFRHDFRTGVDTYNGQIYIGIGKGANVIHDTGTIAFDSNGDIVKMAGPHAVFLGGSEPFCQALS
jgi:hypothetical protein